MKQKWVLALTVMLFIISKTSLPQFKISYEKYKLPNGLEVVLHEDKSDPITAVAVFYHVGSNRETKGRTGFAHLFEHIMFQESQHIPQDQFFKKIQSAGGTLNGGTSNDQTIYYEIIPKNALEMSLWMEADRMGFLLSTVTQEAFMNQQDVVQNEKRQRVDNQPYGNTSYIMDKLMYPENHPYNWQVIGEMEDLSNATLKDVHEFYNKWYGPNNATLVIAGDFDKKQVKQWVERYFGEIKSSLPVEKLKPMPVSLDKIKKAYFEDNFAKSPELNMTYPTAENYTDDSYALDFLGELFAGSKKSPLYKVIVEEKKLAPSVAAFQSGQEVAGTFNIRIRTFPEKSLDDVEKAIKEAFDRFENEKFTDKDLARVKAKIETGFYNGISSVMSKAFQLASYNAYKGSPDYITTDLKKTLSVTKEEIWRVYNKYIKNKNYTSVSCVPKGKKNLVAANAELFVVPEENIKSQGVTKDKKEGNIKVEKIPTKFDRSKEPSKGPDPLLKLPTVWDYKFPKGMKLLGVEQNELPLVQFSIIIKGGMVMDEKDKVGTASILSQLMMQGTKSKTPVELEEAIDELGSTINVFAGNEQIVLTANCLAKKFDETVKLAKEILLEPRFDEKEFARLKQRTIETIKRNESNPAAVASVLFSKLVYGNECQLANQTYGTKASVEALSMADMKNYYNANLTPSLAAITVVGNISKDKAVKSFEGLLSNWEEKAARLPEIKVENKINETRVYFVDFPGAKQSEFRVGGLFTNYSDPEYFPASVMNYKLGGSFNGILNLILREEKGFTYGARSGFSGTNYPGVFSASTSVQSNATLETAEIIRDEINKYQKDISTDDLNFTKDALIKSNALRFETLGGLNGMLSSMSTYSLPKDYIKTQEGIIKNMSKEEHLRLASKYLNIDKMIFLVAGDAKTQLEPLKKLGFGEPILIDKEGKPVK